ncbi:MAG: respiratory nitrate reductase subunit gamma [Magnetococcales bacterium]|nr:respiratory nitrate reductase subunit gamma [Magnetococcales bacterium]MBF0439599.1 respiratory nitrate reductase subunit gamma [Magnetococcales bacterium]
MLTVLSYCVLGIFLIGFMGRIIRYARTPAPVKIPTTPAPVTKMGVVWRLLTEVAFFNSLFKSDKLAWAGGIAFHGALVVVLIRHVRYFVDPLPAFFAPLQIIGIVAGLAMAGALGFLFLRRVLFERVRFISSLADYLILLLLLGIAFSGLLMDFLLRPNIVAIKSSLLNMWTTVTALPPATSPGDYMFLMHLMMVGLLLIIFPFSKLMHAGGIFFSPTRNQVDNPREVRHINPWAEQ